MQACLSKCAHESCFEVVSDELLACILTPIHVCTPTGGMSTFLYSSHLLAYLPTLPALLPRLPLSNCHSFCTQFLRYSMSEHPLTIFSGSCTCLQQGNTPLHIAAISNQPAIVRQLNQAECDLNVTNHVSDSHPDIRPPHSLLADYQSNVDSS